MGRSEIGNRARITQLLHSPARTRNGLRHSLGHTGKIVGVLLCGRLALLRLDGDTADLPGGVRRWPLDWDDLTVLPSEAEPVESQDQYRLGLSGSTQNITQHAVLLTMDGEATGLCGEQAFPLPMTGWSLGFTPVARNGCRRCAELAARA